MSQPLNPYASPRADLDAVGSADDERPWRIDGIRLRARKGVTLPPLCIFTGVPTQGQQERRQLSWTPLWFRVLMVMVPVLGLFAYSVMRRSGDLEYSLCDEARKRRRIATVFGLIGCGATFGAFLLAAIDDLPILAVTSLALCVALLFVARARARMFRIIRIDERFLLVQLTAPAAQALAAVQAL